MITIVIWSFLFSILNIIKFEKSSELPHLILRFLLEVLFHTKITPKFCYKLCRKDLHHLGKIENSFFGKLIIDQIEQVVNLKFITYFKLLN